MFSGLKKYKRSEQLLITAVLLIAVTGLAGWLTNWLTLARFSVRYIPIAPSTAFSFMIVCLAFLFYYRYGRSRPIKLISIFMVSVVFTLDLLILIRWIFGVSFNIETLFVREPEFQNTYLTGRMSPVTAILMALVCVASLLFFLRRVREKRIAFGMIAFILFFISSVLLIGYLYKAPSFVRRFHHPCCPSHGHLFLAAECCHAHGHPF